MKKFLLSIGIIALIFNGCAKMHNSNEVSLSDVNRIYTYKSGVVTKVRGVVIRDDGSGAMIGAMTGTVLGSLVGKGKGNVLATLVGGVSGFYVGNELGKANAKELYIRLDDGREIVTIVRGANINVGDKVRIVIDGNRIIRVEKF